METPKHSQRANGQRLTRRRVPLSCEACRARKLKCNREKPCQNCIVRGEAVAASCSYAERPNAGNAPVSKSRANAEDMRKRINRLENSILSLISSEGQKGKTGEILASIESSIRANDEPEEQILGQAGGQKLSNDTRSTHWDAILNDLGAVKDVLEENDLMGSNNDDPSQITRLEHVRRPGLLTGWAQPPDRATILSSLPSKEQADKLILNFFESYTPSIPATFIVHRGAFIRQYETHWVDPTRTKIIWLGQFFAVLCFSMLSHARNKTEPLEFQGKAASLGELYRIRTAQCLAIADITKPADLMVETLLLHAMAEYAMEADGDMGTWHLSGITMRIALQLGYHRDPSQHPNLTIFEAEMRRRVWLILSQHELLFSVQIGLPRSIRYSECDTAFPVNVFEGEIWEDMKHLPRPRPFEEPNRVSYQISKARILRAYGEIVERIHVLKTQTYEEVMRLDNQLIKARDQIPPFLKLRPIDEMKHDPGFLVMERYILQLFYHKAICVLHRKRSNPFSTDAQYCYSRKTCVDSSLALLDHQASMHKGQKPGGPLVTSKWYHFSLTTHDFLLAAIVLCVDLKHTLSLRKTLNPNLMQAEIEKLNVLHRSRAIWVEVIDECKDAKRAVSILTTVLSKLPSNPDDVAPIVNKDIAPPTPNMDFSPDALQFDPYFVRQYGLGTPASLSDPVDTIMPDTILPLGVLDSFEGENTLAGFDWDAWDQFMFMNQPQGVPFTGAPAA